MRLLSGEPSVHQPRPGPPTRSGRRPFPFPSTPLLVSLLVVAAVCGLVVGLGTALSGPSWSWAVGVVLGVLVVATVVLSVHAGGHAWLVPFPTLALAAAWAVLAATGNWSSTLAWSLAGASTATSGAAVLVAGAALAQRRLWSGPARPHEPLPGADGVAVTALDPDGVVRVAGETWTARSVSGTLPEGAPVHVIAVRGLRLDVWSEAGVVPGPETLQEGDKK